MVLRRAELLVVLAPAGEDASVTAESLLRDVLAELTGTPAAGHVFDRTCGRCGDTDHGKPVLALG